VKTTKTLRHNKQEDFGEDTMKSLSVLSAVLLFVGFGVFLYSVYPQTVKEPYTVWKDETHNYTLKEGIATATSPSFGTYFDAIYNFTAGDILTITASSTDGQIPLSATVSKFFRLQVYASQDNMTAINMDYTIPSSGNFEITVSRYKASAFDYFSTETTANVRITASMVTKVQVQEYRDVTTYPHKDLQIAAIAVMIFGIGVAILSLAQGRNKNQQTAYAPQSSTFSKSYMKSEVSTVNASSTCFPFGCSVDILCPLKVSYVVAHMVRG
jgi:hypothetical protein